MTGFSLTDSRFGMRAIRSGRQIYETYPGHVFDVLKKWPSGLMLDLGAAQGYFTKMMRAKSPKSRVIAVEPFEGNLPYLHAMLGEDADVRILDVAISDRIGESRFSVNSTMSGATEGASNVGTLHRGGQHIVKTTTLDEIVDEPVRMIKMDIQGAEYAALKGGARLFRDHGVDLMFVENSGEKKALKEIHRLGFLVFDSIYTIMPKTDPDLSDWDIVAESKLTTGVRVLKAWPKQLIDDPDRYMKWFRSGSKKAGHFFTDLVCVHRNVWENFAGIVGEALSARS
ncbi:FkbM family methyltransferase [Hyphococcus sp.]|jgi:FkbM family methyltransferase|uniref:FkbM family methyltransferase n=1 Tax=Hyphococcus sp. TaxID=2038636 RepID=UPI003D0DD31B